MTDFGLFAVAIAKALWMTGIGLGVVTAILGAELTWPYIYRWNQMGRKNQRCRVLVRGKSNSALIEFPDGHRAVTSRNALRKEPAMKSKMMCSWCQEINERRKNDIRKIFCWSCGHRADVPRAGTAGEVGKGHRESRMTLHMRIVLFLVIMAALCVLAALGRNHLVPPCFPPHACEVPR